MIPGTGKTRITITVDPHVAAYAESLVATGKESSVSAVFNDALAERADQDQRARQWWATKVAEAHSDPMTSARVARMKAYVDAQIRQFRAGEPPSL